MRVPTPSRSYVAKQKCLAAELAAGTAGDHALIYSLQKELQQEFAVAFALRPSSEASTLIHLVDDKAFGSPGDRLFEHKAAYVRSSGGAFVFIAQPYHLDERRLADWAARLGGSYTIATEWGFYYPGSTVLFLLEVKRATMDRLIDLDERGLSVNRT